MLDEELRGNCLLARATPRAALDAHYYGRVGLVAGAALGHGHYEYVDSWGRDGAREKFPARQQARRLITKSQYAVAEYIADALSMSVRLHYRYRFAAITEGEKMAQGTSYKLQATTAYAENLLRDVGASARRRY